MQVLADLRLAEYVRIGRDFEPRGVSNKLRFDAARSATGWWNSPRWELLLTWLIVPPVFIYKTIRVGPCRFLFDAAGLVRHSRMGEMRLRWSEVAAVHRLRDGYLIELDEGAMPIAYRCFPPGGRAAFEAIVPAPLLIG